MAAILAVSNTALQRALVEARMTERSIVNVRVLTVSDRATHLLAG